MKDEKANGKVNDVMVAVEKHEQNLILAETHEHQRVVPDRGHWSGRFDFLLACLGSAVGLGNVWRFPYLCYKNGGGAFLIPYILMVFLVGMPIFLLELAIGQYSAMGPHKLFRQMSPLFKGLGVAMVLASAMVCMYYNVIIAWTFYYFFDSFRGDLQWQYCSHDFNTDFCFDDRQFASCKRANESNIFNNRTCFNSTYAEMLNITDISEKARVSSAEEYFNLHVLEKSTGIDQLGSIKWEILLCLIGAWTIVACCLIKGIKTSGRVVYFTATFPYVILVILFIRGVTLSGATDGLYYYLVPDFVKLNDITVWQDAAIQVFYSFSIAGGNMITFSSYNRFNNNVIKDVLIIGIMDMLTSIFSGLVIFSMIGFMAQQLGKPISEVVQSGAGLAFIVYPDGIIRMPVSTLWALLFFFMLFLLGIDSEFAMVETIITYIFDEFPKTRKKKPFVVIGVSVVLLILALPLTTNGGSYVLELMDTYAAGWPYMLTGLIECLVISYIYGINNFMNDLKEMTGFNPGPYLRSHLLVSIMTVSPLVILVLLLLSWIQYTPLELGKYVFPMWANAIGWVMAIVTVSFIPIGVIHELFFKNRNVSFKKRFLKALKPTDEWRENFRNFKADLQTDSLTVEAVTSNGAAGDTNKLYPEIAAYDNPVMNESTSCENADSHL